MKLLLTSDGLTSHGIQQKLVDLLGKDISSCNGCIITTASSRKEQSESAMQTKLLLEQMGFAGIDFLDIEYEGCQKTKDYDLIYINGGNPFYLLHQLQINGGISLFHQLVNEKVIAGTSAGAMVLAPTLAHVNELNVIAGYGPMDIEELKDYDAVGLTHVTVVPHYNRFVERDPGFEEKLQRLENQWNLSFERVSDGEAVIIHGQTVSRI